MAAKIVNKAKPKMSDEQWNKALEFVKGGGSVTAIESKYTITPAEMIGLDEIKNNG